MGCNNIQYIGFTRSVSTTPVLLFTPFYIVFPPSQACTKKLYILVPVHRFKGMQLIDHNSKNFRLLKVVKDVFLLPSTCDEVLFLNL
jgi:hypothetical protein